MAKEIRVITNGDINTKHKILKHLHALGYTWASGESLEVEKYDDKYITCVSLHSGSKVRYGVGIDGEKGVRYITYKQLKKDYPVGGVKEGEIEKMQINLFKVYIKVKNQKQWEKLSKVLGKYGMRFVDGDTVEGYTPYLDGDTKYLTFDSNKGNPSVYFVEDWTPPSLSVKQFLYLIGEGK